MRKPKVAKTPNSNKIAIDLRTSKYKMRTETLKTVYSRKSPNKKDKI